MFKQLDIDIMKLHEKQLSQNEIQKQSLIKHITDIKELGYKVYADKELTTHAYVTDGINIGYFGIAQWSNTGIRFITVHKPCQHAGRGYAVGDKDIYEFGHSKVTEDIIKSSFCNTPYGFGGHGDKGVVKYDSFAHFAKSHHYELIEY